MTVIRATVRSTSRRRLCLLAIAAPLLGLALWPTAALAGSTSPIGAGPQPSGLAPVLHPDSPEAYAISVTIWITVALAAVVFALVAGPLIIAVFRHKELPPGQEPPQIYGNQRIETLWTLIPFGLVALLYVVALITMHAVNTAHAKSNDVNIEAIGHQWWWEFRYQDSGFTTANELHLPLNQEVSIHVTGYDVIHSFWIPQLARQIDATPNQIHTIYTTAKKPGIYGAGCYEYCGGPHAWMDFRVVVQPKAQYDAWIRHMKTPAPQTTSPLALQGEQLFFNFSCAACHTISGTPAHGLAGPNLTHVASRWAIAGGVLPMSAHNLGLWVNDPNAYKPGVLMPAYSLSPHDQQTIGAYLSTLK